MSTETRSAREKVQQAHNIPESEIQSEIKTLQVLTQAACSSAPTFLTWKQEKQNADM